PLAGAAVAADRDRRRPAGHQETAGRGPRGRGRGAEEGTGIMKKKPARMTAAELAAALRAADPGAEAREGRSPTVYLPGRYLYVTQDVNNLGFNVWESQWPDPFRLLRRYKTLRGLQRNVARLGGEVIV